MAATGPVGMGVGARLAAGVGVAVTMSLGQRCPYCGAPNDVHQGPTPEEVPDDGDVSVCYRCRRPGVFVVHGGAVSIRKPTEEERQALETHPHYQAALAVLKGPLTADVAVQRWREAL